MKRTIAFLLVLMMVLASLACTAEEKPEPDAFVPLELSIIKLIDYQEYDRSIHDRTVLSSLRTAFDVSTWTKSDTLSAGNGTLRYTLTDSYGDRYDFYSGSPDFVLVTHKNVVRAYALADDQMSVVEDFLLALEPQFDDVFAYLGSREGFETSKLTLVRKSLLERANTLFDDFETYDGDCAVDSSSLNTNGVRMILRDSDNRYLTVYDTYVRCGQDFYVPVSAGNTPFGDDGNVFKAMVPDGIIDFETALRFPMVFSSNSFDFDSLEISLVEILPTAVDPTYVSASIEYSTNAMANTILDQALSGTWTLLDNLESTSLFPRIKLTTKNGSHIYLCGYDELVILVDEDPNTPGAVYYTKAESPQVGPVIRSLSFAANRSISFDLSAIVITQITNTMGDDQLIELTPEQSEAITTLFTSAVWINGNHRARADEGLYLNNSPLAVKDAIDNYFKFEVEEDPDSPYVWINYHWDIYLMPKADYLALMAMVETIREDQ